MVIRPLQDREPRSQFACSGRVGKPIWVVARPPSWSGALCLKNVIKILFINKNMLGWGDTKEAQNKKRLKELLNLKKEYRGNEDALCTFGYSSKSLNEEIKWRRKEAKNDRIKIIYIVNLFISPAIVSITLVHIGIISEESRGLVGIIIFIILLTLLWYLERRGYIKGNFF